MNRNWTFGRKIAAGFTVSFILLLAIGGIAYRSIDSLISTSYWVTHTHQVIEDTAGVQTALTDAETGQRGFVITGDAAYLEPYESAILALPRLLEQLRDLTRDNPAQQKRIDQVESLSASKLAELKRVIEIRRTAGFEAAAKGVNEGVGKRFMDDLRQVLAQMEQNEHDLLKDRAAQAESTVSGAKTAILVGTLLCLLFVVAAGIILTRSLQQQIGTAVGHVQSSSSELQSAAKQQASGAKAQATAMAEISTTINELVATSRQIAESAQRVTQIANQTAAAARQGGGTMDKGQEAVTGIRRQVDLVVNHMLDLGKKSQEIGGVLDIVAELAEQTNILSINATIEASGAGETGRRFAVVADEIRKLSDRVANSTKEIRGLIEDVRGAVNTTVMATESSAKAVDAGARQLTDVAVAFRQITDLVVTTNDASREIELSTKQQATAGEQVRIAVSDVAQTTRETEASTEQTLQTASQLAGLSRDLLRLIQPQSVGA
jgi:methyl-accepting chemotaxis protein